MFALPRFPFQAVSRLARLLVQYGMLLLLALVPACIMAPKQPDKLVLIRTHFTALHGWEKDNFTEVLPAFLKSCEKLTRLSATAPLADNIRQLAGDASDWQMVCTLASQLEASASNDIRQFFEQYFVPFEVRNNAQAEGLFTGYYEIDLRGSRSKTATYVEPLYTTPGAISKPFYSRKQINDGALAGKQLEMLYVDDPVAAFFLHIQGSGRVELDDGSTIRVGYAGQNGQPYVAIGRYLIEQGIIEKEHMSARAIKNWLYANPDKAKGLMETNPSYIFFREIDGEGPIGAQGVALTPERSLAIDKRFLPYGLPIWLETTYPDTPRMKGTAFRKLLVTQDTGGAIRGPVRGDIFFGHGAKAEMWAEYMKNPGRYTLLLPLTLARKF